MGKRLDIRQGDKYGRLTIIKEKQSKRYKNHTVRIVSCICDCGKSWVGRLSDIRTGSVKSCGCYSSEYQKKKRTTHGRYGTLEYKSWQSMKERCSNPKNIKWDLYGGRGIIVCDRWLNSFQNFFDDMGPRVEGTTLDRIDNDGNYEPSNCRWTTIEEQNRNRKRRR